MATVNDDLDNILNEFKEKIQEKSLSVQAYQGVAERIVGIANQLNTLRSNLDTYTKELTGQLTISQNEVIQLREQLQSANAQLNQKTNEKNVLEQKISELNNQIVGIQQQAQQQVNAINNQLQQNEENFKRQMAEMQTDANNKINAITTEKENRITELVRNNETLNKQKEEILSKSAADIAAINSQTGQLRADIERLNKEKADLEAFNNKLINNISNATMKIKDVVNYFGEQFKMPNNRQELERSITESINAIEAISAALQGRTRGNRITGGKKHSQMKGGWVYSATPSASSSISSSEKSSSITKKTTTRKKHSFKKLKSRNRGMKSKRRT